ncbi:MAG: SIS domain-containing protein [Terriglobia bacterium]|jgi:glucosamine--fructose-6-phosphate aminotransferase (isomerizing)
MQLKLPRLAENIQAQPASLARVLQQHCGMGRDKLLHAASQLRTAKRVVITGIGASMFASIPLEYLLCSHGIDAVTVEAAEFLHYRCNAYRDAVVIVVSRSGDSVEIAKLLPTLKGRMPIIGVTNEAAGTLAREADLSINVGSLPDEMVAIQSYTGTLLTLYLLGMATVDELRATQEEVEALLPALSRLIAVNLDELRGWDPFLEGSALVYLLGRGPSYGSALEGALLFNETAKAPAIGMPAASFRHGPVELVDQGFRGLIFAPRGCTCALNVALAQNLTRFGGRVRVIGPQNADGAGLEWSATPSVPEMLSPLFEIVPVQVAALRLAQLKGITVGSFRYTPQVTLDEATFSR